MMSESKKDRGRKGGLARMAALTPEERTNIARKAANIRWSKQMNKRDTDEDVLIVSVKLASGRFETSSRIPLSADLNTLDKTLDSAFMLVEFSIRAAVDVRKAGKDGDNTDGEAGADST